MEDLLKQISNHPVIKDISEVFKSAEKKFWVSGLWGSSRSLFIASLNRKLNFPILVITGGMEEAEIIYEDISSIFKDEVMFFPAWEFPSEDIPSSSETLRERLRFFERVASGKRPGAVVAPVEALLEKWPPLENITECFLSLKQGERLDLDAFLSKLTEMGYKRMDMVEEKGEFSQRGEIIDIFAPTFDFPLRVILEFDKIASLKFFSAATQRTVLEDRWKERSSPPVIEGKSQPDNVILIAPVKESFFRKEKSPLINFSEYFKKDYLFIYEEPAKALEKISSLEEGLRGTLFMTLLEEIAPSMEGIKPYRIKARSVETLRGKPDEVIKEIKNWQKENFHIHLVCNNRGEEKRLKEVLEENGINPESGIKTILAGFKTGFILPDIKLSFLTDQEIFNRYEKKLVQRFKHGIPFTALFELNEGDYVVHVNHGIGRYLGLKHMKVGAEESDYLTIEYQDNARLYVPAEGLDLVQKYVGMQGRSPSLSRLGGRVWSKTKEKARKAIKDMATELLKLQAQRQAFKGYAFSKDSDFQKEFEEAFIYEETPDQEKAIREVKRDMESFSPMERLVVGDAGYGKTEVAMRAAFKAVMNNKQVACLCPTTLLAHQHYNTFSERMADYPITIACLSRFESRASQKKIIDGLVNGKIDILIGTHRLLQKDVSFKNLGLIIIDEEQRFGVAHKEKIRKFSCLVDCITLSATPIPRTLYMGLAGIKYISLINTPPEERLPVETAIVNFDKGLIRRAIVQEIERDGQSFIVHNRIDTISQFADMIKEIVPQARIAIAHGEMPSRELEDVMMRFLKKEIDALVATTIIASGLDIPNANTIIIDNAHTFGLADLYQLRGRVGRFRHRAYAFFIIPKFRSLTEDARKRLKAIEDFTELGSGFKLALRDLEIRGAGNLLGPEQHGFVAAVGFDLYCELLQRAAAEFRGEKLEEPKRITFEAGVDFSLSSGYIPGVKQRLDIYRRMSMLKNRDEIKAFEEELVDRFGALPERAGKVLEALEVKDMARTLGIIYLGLRGKKLLLKFSPGCSLELENLKRIEEDLRKGIVFGQDSAIFINLRTQDKEIIPVIRNILNSIESSRLIRHAV